MPNRDLSHMRESYLFGSLDMDTCHEDPFVQFDQWFHQALEANAGEANAMTLATTGNGNQPSARTVLLKSFNHDGFIFYTNYESRKGHEIAANDRVALLFWWREQQRQVRIEGRVTKLDRESAEAYFHVRPVDSQLAAAASPQSQVIPDRRFLEERMEALSKQYADKEIPLPASWGGYLVQPEWFEFWQGRESRLHDRIAFVREGATWVRQRLAPDPNSTE